MNVTKEKNELCHRCGGSGNVYRRIKRDGVIEECPECKGTGTETWVKKDEGN